MKLVELLARELKEWPAGCPYVVCDTDGEVRVLNTHCKYDFYPDTPVDHGDRLQGLATQGSDTPRVTREEWEAERAKLHTTDEPTTTKTNGEYEQQAGRIERVPTDGPLQWRDRIHAIDAEIHELNTVHTAAVEAREEERIALVQRLELEGLQLIAAKAQPAEDPSDWAAWKAGDIVECLENHDPGGQFTAGTLYVLSKDTDRTDVAHVVEDDAGDENGWHHSNFKLHARAAK